MKCNHKCPDMEQYFELKHAEKTICDFCKSFDRSVEEELPDCAKCMVHNLLGVANEDMEQYIASAERILADNGVDEDETDTVLEAVGFALGMDLYDAPGEVGVPHE